MPHPRDSIPPQRPGAASESPCLPVALHALDEALRLLGEEALAVCECLPLELLASPGDQRAQVPELLARERRVCLVEVTDQDCQVVIIAEAVRELMCLVGGRLDHLGPAPVHEAQVIPEVLGAFSPLVQRLVAGVVERLAIAPAPAGVGAPEAGSKELEPVGVQRPVLDRLVAELDLGRGSVPQRTSR